MPWRADPAVLAGYLRLNLLNGSYVGHYLPQQAYIIDFAGEQHVAAKSAEAIMPYRCCLHYDMDTQHQAWDVDSDPAGMAAVGSDVILHVHCSKRRGGRTQRQRGAECLLRKLPDSSPTSCACTASAAAARR